MRTSKIRIFVSILMFFKVEFYFCLPCYKSWVESADRVVITGTGLGENFFHPFFSLSEFIPSWIKMMARDFAI